MKAETEGRRLRAPKRENATPPPFKNVPFQYEQHIDEQ